MILTSLCLHNTSVLLYENYNTETYLTSVQLWKDVLWDVSGLDTLNQEESFYIGYQLRLKKISESCINEWIQGIGAAFLALDNGTYKIMESSSSLRVEKPPQKKPKTKKGEIKTLPLIERIDLEPALPYYTLVGNSTDTTLFVVKVWNYLKEHIDDGEIRKLIE